MKRAVKDMQHNLNILYQAYNGKINKPEKVKVYKNEMMKNN